MVNIGPSNLLYSSTLVDPEALRIEEKNKKAQLEEDIARKEAKFPGPKELARNASAPLANGESTATLRDPQNDLPKPAKEIRELANQLTPANNNLISISPEAELLAFSATGEITEGGTSSVGQTEAIAAPTTQTTDGTIKTEEIYITETTKAGSVEEIEKISEEAAATEAEEIQTREALEANVAQPTPAKAGDLLDLTV